MNILTAAGNFASNFNPLKYFYDPKLVNKFIVTEKELQLAIKNLRDTTEELKKCNIELCNSIKEMKDSGEYLSSFKEKKEFFEEKPQEETFIEI